MTIADLTEHLLQHSFFLEEAVELLEKEMIAGALQRAANNQSEAAKILGIHRNTLQRKMIDYEIGGKRRKPMAKAKSSTAKRAKSSTRRAG